MESPPYVYDTLLRVLSHHAKESMEMLGETKKIN